MLDWIKAVAGAILVIIAGFLCLGIGAAVAAIGAMIGPLLFIAALIIVLVVGIYEALSQDKDKS